jgi:uncharacterized protein with von Willebrand factor type A (vWA) domain
MRLPDPAAMARVGLMAASMRAGGSRVGPRRALAAYRALLAADPASPRAVRRALRDALCSGREDLALFEAAYQSGRSPGGGAVDRPRRRRGSHPSRSR